MQSVKTDRRGNGMLWLQKTVGSEASIEGIGLHSGEFSRMTLRPAPVNSGLVFKVPGPEGEVTIEAIVENLAPAEEIVRATSLVKDGVRIHTVEHLLAALAGLGINNCEILLEGNEPPVPACGSALSYVELIDKAGIRDQGLPQPYFKINRSYSLRDREIEITAVPSDQFMLTFHVEYDDPAIGAQQATFEITPEIFRQEIAPARTFALMKDVALIQEQGLAKGGSVENSLIFDGGQIAGGQELRFPDEVVRHKILDLLGDLALLGMPLQGHVTAKLAGHAANVAFTSLLAKTERRQPRIYPPRRPENWDIGSIMKIMPHRYPFLLVDRIIELEPGKRVTGIKNVTINEPFFQGHFPGHPIMPAVLISEAMAQVG